MNSFKNSRLFLSAVTAALMVFGWTGASRADLWLAQTTDSLGNSVDVQADISVSTSQIQVTITNFIAPLPESVKDIVVSATTPLNAATITGMGPLADWTATFSSNFETLTLTSATGTDMIAPGTNAVFSLSGIPSGTEITTVKFSQVDTPNEENNATLVPEPSTIVIAAVGALGFLGYSLRRRRRVTAGVV